MATEIALILDVSVVCAHYRNICLMRLKGGDAPFSNLHLELLQFQGHSEDCLAHHLL